MQKEWPRLLRVFNDDLGYQVREGNPALGYELYFVDLSSWKLRLSSRTAVIWVKTKDLDGVTSQHLMESLGDVMRERNLQRTQLNRRKHAGNRLSQMRQTIVVVAGPFAK